MSLTIEQEIVQQEVEHHIPQIVALDMDRTLVDPDKVMLRFNTVAKNFSLDIDKISQAQAEAEKAGKSFEPVSLLKSILQPAELQAFEDQFLAYTDIPILYPDAARFLATLAAKQIPYQVLTYGTSPEWQNWKAVASGCADFVQIMDYQDKGRVVAAWQQSSQADYLLDQTSQGGKKLRAPSVVLIDDKANAFMSLPADATGYLLRRPGSALPSQAGTIPDNVLVITSLDELTLAYGVIVPMGPGL